MSFVRPPEMVEVFWIDSTIASHGWTTVEEYVEALGGDTMQQRTVGFLVYEDTEKVVVALSIGERIEPEQHVSSCIGIPRAAISAIYELERAAPRPRQEPGAARQEG